MKNRIICSFLVGACLTMAFVQAQEENEQEVKLQKRKETVISLLLSLPKHNYSVWNSFWTINFEDIAALKKYKDFQGDDSPVCKFVPLSKPWVEDVVNISIKEGGEEALVALERLVIHLWDMEEIEIRQNEYNFKRTQREVWKPSAELQQLRESHAGWGLEGEHFKAKQQLKKQKKQAETVGKQQKESSEGRRKNNKNPNPSLPSKEEKQIKKR